MEWMIDHVPYNGTATIRIGGFASRADAEAYVEEEGLQGDTVVYEASGASLGRSGDPLVVVLPPGRKKFFNWSRNTKMKATGSAIAFPLPAFESEEVEGEKGEPFRVCPGAGRVCRTCYAHKAGHYGRKEARACREYNLRVILDEGYDAFVEMIGFDLSHMTWTFIRIHDSGDFFNQEYLDAWLEVARRNHDRLFYCYTKSLELDWGGIADLENFRIVQSYGGAYDGLIDWDGPVARVFGPGEPGRRKMEEEGYQYCSDDDWCAIEMVPRIGLEFHHSNRKVLDEKEEVEFLS